jgi:Holliday junction DNA helicase RuvB
MYEEKHRDGGATAGVGEGRREEGAGGASSPPAAPPRAEYAPRRRIRLIRGLPRKRLFQVIHHHARGGDVSRRALGFYLRDLRDRGEYKAASCASIGEFADTVLGMESDEAWACIRVDEALEKLPELERAFAAGEIGWSKLREISRVATPDTERDWLTFAREHRCREVEAAARRKRKGEKPPRPDELGTPRVTFRAQYDLPSSLNTLWQTAIEKLMAEAGEEATPLDALKRMAEMAIGTDPAEKVPPGRRERKEAVYTVVYHLDPDGKAWVESEEGRLPIPREVALAAAEAGQVIEVPELEDPGAGSILFGERGSVSEEERDRPTPAWMRRAVLAREGHHCAICKSRHELRVHHLESRANGGETRIQYLVSVCLRHHSLIHDGQVMLTVNDRGSVVARDLTGRLHDREVSAAEALADAPAEAALAVIEIEAEVVHEPAAPAAVAPPPELPRGNSEVTQVVAAPCLAPAGFASPRADFEYAPATGNTPSDSPGARSVSQVPAGSCLAELPSIQPPAAVAGPPELPRGNSEATQVLVAPHSLPENRGRVRTLDLASASLAELPSVLPAAGWRALEGRLEWSSRRKAFVLGEAESAGLLTPQAARAPEAPDRQASAPSSRPTSLGEVIGQRRVVENLALAARAAKERGEPLGHVILTGSPGLGKTTLAVALAHEMDGRPHTAMGATISEPHQVVSLLVRLEPGDILFIDEIHRLPAVVTECLHAALEDGVLDVLVAERGRARSLRIELAPFTLVGATMEPGDLPEAFRARFPLGERLDPYSEEDLSRIVAREAAWHGIEAAPAACAAVAARSRGTPREAVSLLARALDVAQTAGTGAGSPGRLRLEVAHVEEARRLEIEPDGLRADERGMLELLLARGPMGLEALASTLRIDAATLRNVHEPFLLRRGYVVRTARGREATAEARRRLAANACRV